MKSLLKQTEEIAGLQKKYHKNSKTRNYFALGDKSFVYQYKQISPMEEPIYRYITDGDLERLQELIEKNSPKKDAFIISLHRKYRINFKTHRINKLDGLIEEVK